MSKKYDDIIHLPNHRSKKHPPMALKDRAAQFSPFAALRGYGEAIKETARLTQEKPQLTEEFKDRLNAKLLLLEEHLDLKTEITVTFFLADEKKTGGTYISQKGLVKNIDPLKGILTMEHDLAIPLEDIISIEGEIIDKYYKF